MTPEQDSILRRVFNLLAVGNYDASLGASADGYLKKTVKPELDQILAKPAGAVMVDNTAVLAAIADLKAHPAVISDPTLSAKIDALSKHLGAGTQ